MSNGNTNSQSKIGLILAGGALMMAGYFAGQSQPHALAADGDQPPKVDTDTGLSGALGVPIPNGGAALVKGRDGNAYVVDSRGVFVRASQTGKPLPLP